MADIKPKFAAGVEVVPKESTLWRQVPQDKILIEEVILRDDNETSFYLINNKRFPIRYIEKHYKMLLGSLLKQL